MRVTNKTVLIMVLSLVLLLGASLSFAQDKMTMEEYEAQLAEWQAKLDAAEKGKADCSTANEALQQEIGAVKAETDKVWNEILAGNRDDPMRNSLSRLTWLEEVHIDPPLSPLAYWNLGRGESEVIEYARLHENAVALLDYRLTRRAASATNVKPKLIDFWGSYVPRSCS